MLRKKFLQMLSAEKILQGRNCPTTPFPLKINGLSLSNIMEYCSGSVPSKSSRMIYITWGVNQGLIILVVYFKAKRGQFIQNMLKNYGNHLKADAKTDQ